MKRVMCLYRVSTKSQVDKNDDIPMQRRECQSFINDMDDWVFVGERIEKGVSGYKVSAENRDAIIEIRELAEKKQFDILLVFMFDRLGRREDETPFLVKWFIDHGIEVWSTREGQQKLDSRADMLINFIRFWQAGGESEKTSIRVKAAHTQMIQDGIWRGGRCPYGYKLVFNGRIGKKKQPLHDLAIDEVTGPIVQEIYDLVSNKGYGAIPVANFLNEKYKSEGKVWNPQGVLALVRNPIYTGRLHINDIVSEPKEELRLISDEQFAFAKLAIEKRLCKRQRHYVKGSVDVPPGVAPSSIPRPAYLLAGILYCAYCDHRLVGASMQSRRRGDKVYFRPVYRCWNSRLKTSGCKAQCVYSARKIEEAVIPIVRDYFKKIGKDVDDEWKKQAKKRLKDNAKARQRAAESKLSKLQNQQNALKAEIMKSITGEGNYDTALLKEMMEENKSAIASAEQEILDCEAEVEKEENSIAMLEVRYKNIHDWAAQFDKAPIETQKMILTRLIEKITVDRDYNIEVHFYVTPEDFYGDSDSENL